MLPESDFDQSSTSSVSTEQLLSTRYGKPHVTVAILIIVNLLNYMDRFTIAGIPNFVQQYYSINEEQLGLLQTVFFISYTLLSPIAGYLGDRWHRKYIMLIGLVLWIVVTLVSSFIPPEMFMLFLFTRCLVGVGEASYSTVAPTIISDLFVGGARTRVLGLFYFAVPVGSGLGYVIGSIMARVSGHWQWALRVTPILGIVCLALLVYFHKDPPRGLAEGAPPMQTTAWLVDLKYLVCNSAFVLVSGGFTCVCFILGALTWFGVHLIEMGIDAAHDDPMAWRLYNVPLIFGIGLCFAGIVGVLFGTYLGRRLSRIQANADALVCAGSQFVCAPILFFALLSPSVSFYLCVVLVFLVDVLLTMSWALVSDMTMSVVIPTRRATASAVQMVMTHALGDCISPAIVGAISDAISDVGSLEMRFLSLQRALFLTPFVCVLGAFLFCMLSVRVVRARATVLQILDESKLHQDGSESPCERPLHAATADTVHA